MFGSSLVPGAAWAWTSLRRRWPLAIRLLLLAAIRTRWPRRPIDRSTSGADPARTLPVKPATRPARHAAERCVCLYFGDQIAGVAAEHWCFGGLLLTDQTVPL